MSARMDARATVTKLLHQAGQGAPGATPQLFEVVYHELRALARRMMAKLSPQQTLQPTALVHEAYVRLVGADSRDWKSRQHFFRTAARAMRFILVDQARRKTAAKRSAQASGQDPDQLSIEFTTSPEDVLALQDALGELEQTKPRQAWLVELRFFAGLTEPEAAEVLGLSRASVAREWRYTRYWLYRKVAGSKGDTKP